MIERSINYHFDTFDMEFASIRAAAKTNGATANDVFLAGIAEGLGSTTVGWASRWTGSG